MVQRSQHARLVLEATQSLSIELEAVGKHLDGDVTAQARIVRTEHLANAACAKRFQHFVCSEPGAACEHLNLG